MIIDLHCHTKYSYDCYLEPLDLIKRARELGLARNNYLDINAKTAEADICVSA
jgi:predicted metal-dependent phosphoesterase TrpH